ncbi:hypothetical protein EB809_18735 [Marinobacter sp. R17]|nr:hypothetical protein EB809_18735 [Marinobacter sp. R17]
MSKSASKVFDFVEHEKKIDKIIERSFESSYISNAKWRKCFAILDDISPDLQVIWKFVGSQNNGVRYSLPSIESLEERHLSSRFWFGPAYYKEIEWIEFPKVGKPYGKEDISGAFFHQDVATILAALNDIGQFYTENTDLGFRLYGHR